MSSMSRRPKEPAATTRTFARGIWRHSVTRRVPCFVQCIGDSAGMAVTVSVLGSGSRGNATFIKTEQVRLLIDAGMSRKELAKRLESIGEDPDGIDAVLITHEHGDHAGGLRMLLKDLPLQAFLTTGTIS